ncbi:MAG: tRNA lysidine(34) synthetase TilS [Trueperaceae bacterium]
MDVPAHLGTRLELLAPRAARVLAAVSGGADSVALLRGLVAGGYDVVVGHLDHGLRPVSAEDARFVLELAEELGLEARVQRVDVTSLAQERGWNLEDAARRVRYEFLTRNAHEVDASAVITGHTLDDQAETVLMQLLRGAAYLRGMPEVSRQVVRPLLDVPRESLVAYLVEIGQTWREDSTNQDVRWLRAWLRQEVTPLLRRRFPTSRLQLARHAFLQRDVADYIREAAERLRHEEGFDQAELSRAHPAVQREAVRFLFDEAGAAPAMERIEEVRGHLGEKRPYRQTLRPGVGLRLAYGRLELARTAPLLESRAVTAAHQLPGGLPERVLTFPGLTLRGRRPGDRMRLAGGSKSLARLLIDRKIPREERDGLTVLASGSRILWAEGIGAAFEVAANLSADAASEDLRFMERALELARHAASAEELPVGAVLTRAGEIIGEGHNETEGLGDPTAHAELLALRRAAERLGDWRLSGCTLYVTLEPCPMCAGAMLMSHLKRVVYGAANRRDGALGSVADLREAPWKRRLEVLGGVRADEAGGLLSRFFAGRRH